MSNHFLKSSAYVAKFVVENARLKTTHTNCRMAYSVANGVDPVKLQVVHDTTTLEFYIQLKVGEDDDSKAVLQYSYINPTYVDLEHTVVPVEFRGHGIAKRLAQVAFDHFVGNGLLIRPTCTYLQKFYNENPLPRYKDNVKWD